MSETGKYLERKLKRFGIHISGKTGDGNGRGEEIEEWLERNAAGLLEGWCVIDSEIPPDYADFADDIILFHTVKTCALSGLTEKDAEKVTLVLDNVEANAC